MSEEALQKWVSREKGMSMVYNANLIDFQKYRKLETLPKESWEQIDSTVITTAKESLVGIADLNANPSTNSFYDGMASSVYTHKRTSEIGDASVGVDPEKSSDTAILEMDDLSIPMLVTWKDFTLNTKTVNMANRTGFPLSLTLVEEATRSVARKLESNLFIGNFPANGATMYGYCTFPQRQIYTLTADWALPGTTPESIVNDVIAMMQMSRVQHHFGPWYLYIPWEYAARMDQDYLVTVNQYPGVGSIEERLMQLRGLIGVRISQYCPSDSVVLVEMSSETVILINGMPIRALAWEPPGTMNWNHRFKVMTITVPLLIADYLGNCGIVHGSV